MAKIALATAFATFCMTGGIAASCALLQPFSARPNAVIESAGTETAAAMQRQERHRLCMNQRVRHEKLSAPKAYQACQRLAQAGNLIPQARP